MNEKKVVAVIVEGPSDEASLGPMIKEFFASSEVRFVVIHGDITSDGTVDHDNIVSRINDLVETVKDRYRYTSEDFLRIIHICDTDGVFAENTVVEADVPSIRYYTDHVEAKEISSVIERNERKAKLLFKLRTTGKVNGIDYRLYYNSCNLEHVLWNELRYFSSHEKMARSDEFAEMYEGNLKAFIEFISDEAVAVPGTFKETWDFIEKGKNSLNRHSNIHLIFQ